MSPDQHRPYIRRPALRLAVEHKLIDILVIAVCPVVGQAESFKDIAFYGRCKRGWLGRFLEPPNGILLHDTFMAELITD